jgi:phosphoribosylglycinamide formyltransferase-1
VRFAILASGNGTNLQALIDAQRRGKLAPAEIALVVVNRPRAYALERAEKADLPAILIDHREYKSRAAFEQAMLEVLDSHRIEAVVLAGFMRILTASFLERFPHRVLNTHPALCPAFPGINAPAQAIEHGVKISGCTVHFVDSGVDTGPIIFQEAVNVQPDDTAETLHARIQVHEHHLLPQAAQLLAAGKLNISGRKVTCASE